MVQRCAQELRQTSGSKCSLLILRKTRRTRSSRQRGCSEVAHRLQNASCIIHQWLLPFSSRPAPTSSRYQRRRLGFNLRLFPLGFACFQLNAGTETEEFTHQLKGPSEEGPWGLLAAPEVGARARDPPALSLSQLCDLLVARIPTPFEDVWEPKRRECSSCFNKRMEESSQMDANQRK